jgi:hypothetical protein
MAQYTIATGADDGSLTSANSFSISLQNIIFGHNGHQSYFRFQGIAIPQGSELTSAKVTFQQYNIGMGTPVSILCAFINQKSPLRPSNASAMSAMREYATEWIPWDIVPLGTQDGDIQSPELMASLQEIINRSDWVSGDAVILYVKDNGSPTNVLRYVKAYDNPSGGWARLDVTYDPAILAEITEEVTLSETAGDGTVEGEVNEGGILGEEVQTIESLIIEGAEVSDLATYDGVTGTAYFETIAEALGLLDDCSSTSRPMQFETIIEELSLLGLGYYGVLSSRVINDTLTISGEFKTGWVTSVLEALQVLDLGNVILGLSTEDWLSILDYEENNWNGREILFEGMTVYDLAGLGQIIQDTNIDQLDFVDSQSCKLTIKILEALGFNDLAAVLLSLSMTTSSTLQMNDAPRYGFNDFIIEILSLIDAEAVIGKFLEKTIEVLDFGEESFWQRAGIVSAEDLLELVDHTTNLGRFYSTVYDMLAMEIIIELDGEVWQCYVLNTPHFHPSVYSGFDFNSYCVYENKAYGANGTGIYELTGNTDIGEKIRTGVILSKTDFGMPNHKRFRNGYLGVAGDLPVMVFETENGERVTYAINKEGKVVGSHGLKSKKWVLSIADYDTLTYTKLIPIILTR